MIVPTPEECIHQSRDHIHLHSQPFRSTVFQPQCYGYPFRLHPVGKGFSNPHSEKPGYNVTVAAAGKRLHHKDLRHQRLDAFRPGLFVRMTFGNDGGTKAGAKVLRKFVEL